MSETLLEYRLPQQYRISDIKNTLKDAFALVEKPARHFVRCYYDTFDWRLYQEGCLLLSESEDGRALMVLRGINTTLGQRTVNVETVPAFADDFPSPMWRQRLGPLLSPRALLPQLNLQCHAIPLQYLDAQGKLRLQLVIENNRLKLDKGYRMPGKRIRLLPVKGYETELRQVVHFLTHDLGLVRMDADELTSGLALLQRHTGDYSAKLDVVLEPGMTSEAAMKKILLQLLDTMERNEAGVIKDIDPEFLHDFRVALRRTRSALGQIKGVFDKPQRAAFRNEFSWLGGVTGPTRDLHVYLMQYESYCNSLPPELRPHLAPLKTSVQTSLAQEKKALVRHLKSQHYRHMKQDWRAFLSRAPVVLPELKHAQRPIKEVAGERIWKMVRRVLKDGHAITAASPAEKLHRLRIDCKKLRYLLEFFVSLYPPAKMKRLIKALKQLQDNLGEFNDLQVQMASLQHFQEQMAAQGESAPQTEVALEQLIAHLNELQLSQRLLFHDSFSQFSAPKTRALFEALFKPQETA
jgi:CHAD domain-containing protein